MTGVSFSDDGFQLRGELTEGPQSHLFDMLAAAKLREGNSRSLVTLTQAKPLCEATSWLECVVCFHGKCVVCFHGSSMPQLDV